MDLETRRRILDASVTLIETEGLAALSMREVARRAGVSHQAPYHYFEGREAILAALAQEGFVNLTASLRQTQPGPSLETRLIETGLTYVRFAIEHPAHFRLMFRPELVDLSKFPAAREASREAFAELENMVREIRPALRRRVPLATLADLHWSIVHGLAELLLEGSLGRQSDNSSGKLARARSVVSAHARLLLGDAKRAPTRRKPLTEEP